MWIYNGRFGVINNMLAAAGIDGPDWLGHPAMAMPALIVMSLWVIGSPVIIYSAALKDVPASLCEAADLDGVRGWGRFWHVTLPSISPAVLFNAVMSLIWSMQVFAPPQIMTRGGPANSTLTYSLYVYLNAFKYGRMGYASALAWVQVLITIILTVLLLRAARRFVHYRAA
jgi:multiple sugar transport system permease protein